MRTQGISRRRFVRLALGAAGVTSFLSRPTRMSGQRTVLRIAKWRHVLPQFDAWFDDFAKAWGEQHNTEVIVDHLPIAEVTARADDEVARESGHDLFMFPTPPATYQKHAIDHQDVYAAVSRKHGNVVELAHKSTFNPETKQYFAFADSFIPAPLLYLRDAWAAVNLPLGPSSYAELLAGGAKIREKSGLMCGLTFAACLEGNVTLQGMLWSFGSTIVDENGKVAINTPRTIGALRLAKEIYDRAGGSGMLTPPARNSAPFAKQSCTVNAISLVRQVEEQNPGVARQVMLSPPMHGLASKRLACPSAISCYVIWKFSKNRAGAHRFLVDLVDASAIAFEKSRYCNFPCFPSMVPDLVKRLANDSVAEPSFKYKELEDALHWTQNVGYPGYATPGACEVFNSSLIPRMFASVVRGEATPEVAAAGADADVKLIFRKWSSA